MATGVPKFREVAWRAWDIAIETTSADALIVCEIFVELIILLSSCIIYVV
ncbi:hypothetical protein [Bathymodiolus heckerae thiotrophic gill symbiont]|nr:hypothetical protein [Bathymodiolus heckerae thiotrophic gill symbiont]